MEYMNENRRKAASQLLGRISLTVIVEFPHKCEICKRAILSDPGCWRWNRPRGEGEAGKEWRVLPFPFPSSLCFSTSLLMAGSAHGKGRGTLGRKQGSDAVVREALFGSACLCLTEHL